MVARLLACAAALVLFGAGPQPPYVIDAIVPLTGPSAYSGAIHATALRVYETVVNATGGIGGRPLHIDIHDDQSNASLTVQLTNQIVARRVPVILGSALIGPCTAEEPIVLNGPVEYCLSPGLVTKQSNVFSSSVANTYIVPAQIKLMRERGYKRIAVISTTDASGAVADGMMTAAMARPENKGLLVANEHMNPQDISATAQFARIKAADPQAIVLNGVTGTAFGTALRALHDEGLSNVPVEASAANMDPAQLEALANIVPNELIFNTTMLYAPGDVHDRGVRAAIAELRDAYRKAGALVTPQSSFAWDPAKIVVSGLRKLGPNATGDRLAAYISA